VCGAPETAIDEGGFCSVCGMRRRVGADRVELDLTIAAGVSDRGRVHRRNEDAFALEAAAGGAIVAVVCDGISSASASDAAARSAASATAAALLQACADPSLDIGAAVSDAIEAAHSVVGEVAWTTRSNRGMPACTIVAAVCREGEVAVGWVGDSRAYWADGSQSRQLTVDDSWAQEQIAEGLLTPEQAGRDPRSHSITHWVGADAPERPPGLVRFAPSDPGRLVLCTDGLWNYVDSPAELGELINALPAGASAAAVARALTDTALARGGRDNITVTVVDVDPS
jgi:serine/threonine protein phosphatase PrpC